MVAYNFKAQFADAVASGAKCQTIRAVRTGKSRHVRVGEKIQLYTGMRTKACRKLIEPDPVCVAVWRIRIDAAVPWDIVPDGSLDAFARADGFKDWSELRDWFDRTHGLPFEGVLIRWRAEAALSATHRDGEAKAGGQSK